MLSYNKVKRYCCEDLSLIENYDLAVADQTQKWACHHRKETDEGLSADELKKLGLYWNRPASELIFLPPAEHTRLHKYGNTYWLGRHHTNDAREKIGTKSKGRHHIGAGLKGDSHPKARAVYQIDKTTCEIIKKWNCVNDAARALGIHSTNIVKCCKGKCKSAGGYIWRYVEGALDDV